MKKLKAIVTGGAGFIGSHIAEELVDKGYHVIIIDDLSTGKLANIEPYLKKGAVEFVRGSITDLDLLQKRFKGVTYVFHQAALASVPRSVKDPIASHEVNVTGTLNVLVAARDNGVKKVVYASSSSVYGDTPTLPKKEDMPPSPQSPYAVNKLAGEYYCQVFHKIYGLSTVSLRYFNVYGPRQDPDSQYAAVIPLFIKKALKGEAPIIFGDGEQSRDFTFIKDVVAANILSARDDITGVYNIATGQRITVNKLAEVITKLTKSKVAPIREQPRAGDILHSLADISKAKKFGYKPEWNVEEGVVITIKSFIDENSDG
jgi:UDP-glucose 4-epimerase